VESYECSSLDPTFVKRFYIPYTIFHFLLPVASYLTDHNVIKYLRLSLCEEQSSSYTFVSSFLLTFFHLFLSLLKHSDNEASSCLFPRRSYAYVNLPIRIPCPLEFSGPLIFL